jgi:hypothetical protein
MSFDEGHDVTDYHRDPETPLGAMRLIATEDDGRAAARAGVPIGALIDPHLS